PAAVDPDHPRGRCFEAYFQGISCMVRRMQHFTRMQHWMRLVLVTAAALAACSAPPPSTFGGGKSGNPDDPNGAGGTFGGGNTPGSNGKNGTGTIDNGSPCDDGITGNGAEDVAKAMGLCKNLVSAKFTRGYGRDDAPKAEQAGVLEKFGNVIRPREGK